MWQTDRMVGLLVLVAYAAWRTWCPIDLTKDMWTLVLVTLEAAIAVAVLAGTDQWGSPYVFSLIAAVGVAGFAVGFGFALRLGVMCALLVAVPFLGASQVDPPAALRLSAQWAVELVLVATIAGYARRLSGDADARHTLALDRVGRLCEANELLSSLHEIAQELPSSLDTEEVLDATVTRLRSFWDLTSVAILVPDETSDRWMVVRQEGVRLPTLLGHGELPAALRQAAGSRVGVTYPVLTGDHLSPGLSPTSGSGLYAPLHARGQLVGLLAVEQAESGRFDAADLELLDGFTETAALAIDNAHWFSRLKTVGADAERTRIARELHDRVGQSLASLGFELDRLSRHSSDEELRPGIDRLRRDLREAMGEIRDTLYDMRTDVSEESGLVDTLSVFLERVERRTDVAVALLTSGSAGRLPLPQERKMWRVAQEAITNAERHGRAKEINVRWFCDGVRAELEVADDGCGFEWSDEAAAGSYGMLGMRERAASIGAILQVDSAPGRGTRVRCSLGAP